MDRRSWQGRRESRWWCHRGDRGRGQGRRDAAGNLPPLADARANVARRILWALLALTPFVLVARYILDFGETTLFSLSALALIALAWLIGDAAEHAAAHTGPVVGRVLNGDFVNAAPLI